MTALMLIGCVLAAGVAVVLSLLLSDALRRERADDAARATRRARALHRLAPPATRLVPAERRRVAEPVPAERRRAA